MNATADILPHTLADFEEVMLSAFEFAAWKAGIACDDHVANQIVRGTTGMAIKVLSLYPPEELAKTVKDLAKEIK